jgi:hypothetical protein
MFFCRLDQLFINLFIFKAQVNDLGYEMFLLSENKIKGNKKNKKNEN